MDRPTKQRIKQGILGLIKQPPEGDIKALQGFSDSRRRLRIGKYRVIYRYAENREAVYIMDIDSRGDIYK